MKVYQVINCISDYEDSVTLVEGTFAALDKAKAYKRELEDAHKVLRLMATKIHEEHFDINDEVFGAAVLEYGMMYPKSNFDEFNESTFIILAFELDDVKDDIVYNAALTLKHEELAGMYAICNKREYELQRKMLLLEQSFFLLPANGACELVLLKEDFNVILGSKEEE
jgi:hypothetical protein